MNKHAEDSQSYRRDVRIPTPYGFVKTVRFHTAVERLNQNNNEFALRFYVPRAWKGSTAKIERVFVLLNGLAESDVAIYDELGGELAKRGTAAVLLPLPNHFCRWSPTP